MRTYKQRLYTSKKIDKRLNEMLFNCWLVYNHLVVLCDRNYRIFKNDERFKNKLNPSKFTLCSHLTKMKRTKKWNPILSSIPCHTYQQIAERVANSYKLFFSNLKNGRKDKAGKPKRRKFYKYHSFTLYSDATGLCGDTVRIGRMGHFRIVKTYKEYEGRIRRVTIKRDRSGKWWCCICTDSTRFEELPRTGHKCGWDFGMKAFLTSSDGNTIESPRFLLRNKKALKKAHKNLSRRAKGSKNRRKAREALSRLYARVENQRHDWQWKVAKEMVRDNDVLCFEKLNLSAMKKRGHRKVEKNGRTKTEKFKRFGAKVSDYAYGEFLQKVEYLCRVHGREFVQVSPWFPSSQTCSECGYKNKDTKDLNVREWTCPKCGAHHDRDINAARNILREGTSSLGRGSVRPRSERSVA